MRALQSGASPGHHSCHLHEQTSQTTAGLMRFFGIILIAVALVFSVTSRADSATNQLIRSLGNFQLDNSGSRLEILKTNDDQTLLKVKWQLDSGYAAVAPGNSLNDEWFVFVENSSRVWIFDGKDLAVAWQKGIQVKISSSPEEFKNCPKQVREALPPKVQKRYFKKV